MAIERIQGATAAIAKLGELEKQVYPKALARALNRVGDTVKSRSAKAISDATGLKQGSVRRRIVYRQRATIATPTVILEISGKPLNLVEFVSGGKSEARSPRGGVTANAWGKRRKYPGVFLARMPASKEGEEGRVIAVQRSAAGRKRTKLIQSQTSRWKDKSPHVEAVFGAGIAREAAAPLLARERAAAVAERLPIELKQQTSYAIKQLAQAAGRRRARRRS